MNGPRAAIGALQAVVTGRIVDDLTSDAPVRAVSVRLLDRDRANNPVPLSGRVAADGRFTFYGPPRRALPGLQGRTYRLRLEAAAPGYEPRSRDFTVGPAAQPTTIILTHPKRDAITVELFDSPGAPLQDHELRLRPDRVRLTGRVTGADQPTLGLDGATVRAAAPGFSDTATTDAAGRFAIGTLLPRRPTVLVEVTHPGYEDHDLTYPIIYGRPENQLAVTLRPS